MENAAVIAMGSDTGSRREGMREIFGLREQVHTWIVLVLP